MGTALLPVGAPPEQPRSFHPWGHLLGWSHRDVAYIRGASGISCKGRGSCFLRCPAWDVGDEVACLTGKGFFWILLPLGLVLAGFPMAQGKEAARVVLAPHFPFGSSMQEA